jgi:predicted alpha/beta hydrolase family esterase
MSAIWSAQPPMIIVVPGLREHVEDHWQSILANELPRVRVVPPLGRANLDCAVRVRAIEEAAQSVDGPVLFAAHSGGVIALVHWAMRRTRDVLGALLAAPPDFEKPLPEGYPTMQQLREGGWLPVPRQPLPFPTTVAASRNDPLCSFHRASEMARDWRGTLVDAGHVGHLNPASGFGRWELATELLDQLMDGAIAREAAAWAQPLRC